VRIFAFAIAEGNLKPREPNAIPMAREFRNSNETIDGSAEMNAYNVAQDALFDDYTTMEDGARLWPQAEWLKASLILDRPESALQAASALAAYLETSVNGLWHDKMSSDGNFIDEPAPASSLYHIASTIWELESHLKQGSCETHLFSGRSQQMRL